MADQTIRVRILGLDRLDSAFDAMIRDIHTEIEPGFVPRSQYKGLGGIPHSVTAVERAAVQNGFTIRGEGWD